MQPSHLAENWGLQPRDVRWWGETHTPQHGGWRQNHSPQWSPEEQDNQNPGPEKHTKAWKKPLGASPSLWAREEH